MEKEGRGQERPQSWKYSSVGMGSKMEVVLTVPHISHRTQGEGIQGGLWERGLMLPWKEGRKPRSGVPTHPLEATKGEIIMQSGPRHNPVL